MTTKDITQHETALRCHYEELVARGKHVKPRGLEVIEIENYAFSLPPYVRFANFADRKLNLDYIKTEFLWYLKGDKFDTSITEYAKMWSDLINEDGTINSNYGQYIFGEQQQFLRALSELKKDKDSRRATIMILSHSHLDSKTNDYPCTYAINFRIRNNALNMSVRMRSQDAIYGFGNDIPCFSFIHEMMTCALQDTYDELECGEYHHCADSFHVYERHFDMLNKIAGNGIEKSKYDYVECPRISGAAEVAFLLKHDFTVIPDEFHFSKWLTTFSQEKFGTVLQHLKLTKS